MQEKIIDLINDSIRNFSNISNDEHMISLIEQISDIIISALDNENKLLLCGNGGSAACFKCCCWYLHVVVICLNKIK